MKLDFNKSKRGLRAILLSSLSVLTISLSSCIQYANRQEIKLTNLNDQRYTEKIVGISFNFRVWDTPEFNFYSQTYYPENLYYDLNHYLDKKSTFKFPILKLEK